MAVPTITPSELQNHMSVLASDGMAGRRAGTSGFDRAARYVAGVFRALGLEAGSPGFLQRFAIIRGTVDERRTTLALTVNGVSRHLTYGRDFVSYGTTAANRQ